MYSSSLSDLKKPTAVDESLSKTSTRCSVPENTNQLQGVTWLLVILCSWHHCNHFMSLMALSMAPFSSLGQDDWNKVKHYILVMWCQCWHYMTHMASSMAPLYLLFQVDLNVMQYEFSVIWHFWHCHPHHLMPMILSMGLIYSLGQANWNNAQCNFFGHFMPLMILSVSHETSVIHGTILLVKSG